MQHAVSHLPRSFAPALIGNIRTLFVGATALSLLACGGGSDDPPATPAPQTYTIGGTVSGLAGTGLALQNNGAGNFSVAANGTFTIASSAGSGTAYSIVVGAQPTTPSQTCVVANGSGTVGNTNVTNVAVTCTTNTFVVSATVSGLAGSGLMLRNNGGNDLAVATNGVVNFTMPIASGAAYAVTVGAQPNAPSQTCTVANGNGTVGGGNVTNVAINCVTNSFVVSATVSGLAGSGLVLQNNGGNDLIVAANGGAAFSTPVASGASYDVRVLSQPATPNQRCTVANGRGTVGNANVTSPTVACVTQIPRFAYSLDYGSSSLSIYGVDAASGLARPRGYVVTASNPVSAASDPQQRFWFVLSSSTATLSAYRHDDVTGALSEVSGSPYATGGLGGATGPANFVVHPSGNFVYVMNNSGTNNIGAFSINQTSGVLTPVPGQPFAGTEPIAMTIDATGAFGYVTQRGTNSIYTYSIDTSTGSLSEVANSRVSTGALPGALVMHANARLAYVSNVADGTISAFLVNPITGRLTPATNSPFAAGTNPATQVYLHGSGKFLYARNAGAANGAGSISAYTINQLTGALTPIGSPMAIGANSVRMTADPAGRFLFVTNQGAAGNNGSLSQFRIDSVTGALTPLAGIPIWPGRPYYVSVEPSGQFVYVTSAAGNTLYAYSLNVGNGALTLLPYGAEQTTRDLPIAFNAYSSISTPTAATFTSSTAYVSNSASAGSVGAYRIASNGAPSLIDTAAYPSMLQPAASSVHPSGSKLFVVNRAGNSIFDYNITASGALTSLGAGGFTTGSQPSFVALDTSGRFSYTANSADVAVFGLNPSSIGTPVNNFGTPVGFAMAANGRFLYALSNSVLGRWIVNTTDGALVAGGGMTVGGGATALAIDPAVKFAFVAIGGGISVYTIDPIDGFSPSTAASNLTTGIAHRALTVDPTGRYLYAANGTSNSVSAFRINRTSGALTAIASPYAAGNNPVSIAIDYSGRYAYAVNQGSSTISAYSIDPATGALTALTGTPASTGASASHIASNEVMQ